MTIKTKAKGQRLTKLAALELSSLNTLGELLSDGRLYDMYGVSKIVDRCVRYLRQLCREQKVDHCKLLGRYYMTPEQVAALLRPIDAKPR